jgi:hypothetical protein
VCGIIYFAISEGALGRFKKECPAKFNMILQTTHQEKHHTTTMHQAIYARSIAAHCLDRTRGNIIDSVYSIILPIHFVPTLEDNANAMEESKTLQKAYYI